MTYTIPQIDSDLNGLVDLDKVDFDPVLQSELTSHTQNSSAHHTRFNDEEARDAAAGMISGGTNIDVSVDDANDTLTISSPSAGEDTTLSESEVKNYAYPVAESNLAFDTATQTELDSGLSGKADTGHSHGQGDLTFSPVTDSELSSHASSNNAHHSKTPQYSSTTTSSNYTASNYEAVLADASSGAVTVTLPSPSNNSLITIKKTDSSNTVTVDTSGSQTIDGNSSKDLQYQYEALEVMSDGSNWYIV